MVKTVQNHRRRHSDGQATPPVGKLGLDFKIEHPAGGCAGTVGDKLPFLLHSKADTVRPQLGVTDEKFKVALLVFRPKCGAHPLEKAHLTSQIIGCTMALVQ